MTKSKINEISTKGSLLRDLLVEDNKNVEFYTKGAEGMAQVGSTKMTVRDFFKRAKSGEPADKDIRDLVGALAADLEAKGIGKDQAVKVIMDYLAQTKNDIPDINVTTRQNKKPDVSVDYGELKAALKDESEASDMQDFRQMAESGHTIMRRLTENKQYFENKIAQATALAITAYFKIGQTVSADSIVDALLKAEEKFEWDLAVDAFQFLNDQLAKNNLEFLGKVPTIKREGLTSYTITGSYEDEYDTDLNGVPLSEDPEEAKKAIINSLLAITGKKDAVDGALQEEDEVEPAEEDMDLDLDLDTIGDEENVSDDIKESIELNESKIETLVDFLSSAGGVKTYGSYLKWIVAEGREEDKISGPYFHKLRTKSALTQPSKVGKKKASKPKPVAKKKVVGLTKESVEKTATDIVRQQGYKIIPASEYEIGTVEVKSNADGSPEFQLNLYIPTGDRGPRIDHGGGDDGDDWMDDYQVEDASAPYRKRWQPRLDKLKSAIQGAGFEVRNAWVDYDEKGYVSLTLSAEIK